MNIKLPKHRFEYWTNPSSKHTPVLIVGAGLSSGLAPRPDELIRDLIPKQHDIEDDLGVKTGIQLDLYDSKTLYHWAGRCIAELLQEMPESKAKIRFATAIGLMNDARFAAKANVPLRGTTPRHRVIARLAREGRIRSVWSTNWDLWLEAAFESVGIECITKATANDLSLPKSWISRYEGWVPPTPPTSDEETLTLFKPHGCIRALHEGNTRFLVTDSELNKSLRDHEPQCVVRMKADLTNADTCIIGWSASENYLQQLFADLKDASVLSNSLAIVDPFPKLNSLIENESGHLKLINAYGKEADDVVCEVKPSGLGSTDDLMLWIQFQRGLGVLASVCANDKNIVEVCMRHSKKMQEPLSEIVGLEWAIQWFDSFLPVWLRLCFNCQAQEFVNGVSLQAAAIPIHLRDAHIPWGDIGLQRNDLRAAANIYRQIDRIHSNDDRKTSWDFDAYPGGFWNSESQHLLVPVPIWCEIDAISLAALKPLIDSRHWNDKGQIRKLSIVPIYPTQTGLEIRMNGAALSRWKQELCALMPHAAFATESSIFTEIFDEQMNTADQERALDVA